MRRASRTRLWIAVCLAAALVAVVLPLLWEDFTTKRAHTDRSDEGVANPGEAARQPDRDGFGALPANDDPPKLSGSAATEPHWGDARSKTLPPAFVGDFALKGIVVDSDGTPVKGAAVQVRPGWIVTRFAPVNEVQARALETRSGDRGHFRFDRLPRTHDYEITAVSNHAIGTARAPRRGREGDGNTLVRVELQPTWMERIRFRSADGAAVVPAGDGPLPLYGRVLFQSQFGPPSLTVARTLRHLGIDPRVAEGEFLIVYSRLEFSMAPGLDPAEVADQLRRGEFVQLRSLRDPRFEPVDYRSPPRRSGERAAAYVVAVDPRPTGEQKLVHEVAFPDLDRPAPWGESASAYGLRVAVEGLEKSVVLTRRRPSFVAPGDSALVFRIAGLPDKLETRRTRRGDRVVIAPRYPPLAFLSVYYTPRTSEAPSTLSLHAADDSRDLSLGLAMLFPGYARIGPVPIGRYRLRMQWPSGSVDDNEPTAIEDWHGPFEVAAGHQVVRWR